jgi:hypothetical protein
VSWPAANVSLANVSANSDRISNARADIYDAFTKLNEIITEGPGTGPDILVNTIDTFDTGTVEFKANVTAPVDYFVFSRYTESVYSGGNTSTAITPNYTNGLVQTFTANNNFTLNEPTNMIAGSSLVLIITQDGTGNRVMTADTDLKFANGAKTLSSAGSAVDMITIFYTGSIFLCSLQRNYS